MQCLSPKVTGARIGTVVTGIPVHRFSRQEGPFRSFLDLQPARRDVQCRDQLSDGSFLQTAKAVAAASAASKVVGLVREGVIAAYFGVSSSVDAFAYASIIPSFFITLVGGVNGPIYTASATVATHRDPEEAKEVLKCATTLVGATLAGLSLLMLLGAAPLLDITAPGLAQSSSINPSQATRSIAILQARILAPTALLAGLSGIGFGACSAKGSYTLPALAPALSSLAIISSLAAHWAARRSGWLAASDASVSGGVALAVGCLIGAVLQWAIQVWDLHRCGLGAQLQLAWPSAKTRAGLLEVFWVALPACLSMGVLQLATCTDMYFASFFPGAAAALGYANLLAMAPIGILSSSILMPSLTLFAASPSSVDLADSVSKVLLTSVAAAFALSSVAIPLAGPLVALVFQRHAFSSAESALVSTLLAWYISGAAAYVARDVLVRAFYVRQRGGIPGAVSCGAVLLNVFLDWLLIQQGCGPIGLVAATVAVNTASALALLGLLNAELPLRLPLRPLCVLCMAAAGGWAATAAAYTSVAQQTLPGFFGAAAGFLAPSGSCSGLAVWLGSGLSVATAAAVGVSAYCALAILLGSKEVAALRRHIMPV